ncbi:MAG: hypothetical protein IKU24_04295 [Clostridia bacterium]|nr:hypothetical protein [Clostridia bacterium]
MVQLAVFPKEVKDNPFSFVEKEEAVYQNHIKEAAKMIFENKIRFVFLAGPSCSGKTTTALRLEKALLEKGKRVLSFSTDDFFFDKERAPINEDGTPNYDAFEHTDSALIIKTLHSLQRGEKTALPSFDFVQGKRTDCGKIILPEEYDIFLLEGIHALNDKILENFPKEENFLCFYLDVTKGVKSEDSPLFLSPEEIRFCRRLIRDFKHRGACADLTWKLWKNVLSSEKEILHPFRKNAAMTISTNFSYEISVEKEEILPLLGEVKEESSLFTEAKRILSVLESFPELSQKIVPKNSVLREFID